MNSDNKHEGPVDFVVVFNHEQQYSIWPSDQPLPPGWQAEGKAGDRQECLDHIKTVWTDMRPLSLREKMQRDEQQASERGQ